MDNGASSYRRFLDGEDEGFYEIVRDYKDGLLLYVNGIVGNLHDAEEVVQDTFTRLAIRKPRFFGRSTFKTWLYTIGRNIALDLLRKRGDTVIDLDEVQQYISEEKSIEDDYLKTELQQRVREYIRCLKPEYAQALWLTYIEGFSGAQAARIMKKTKHGFENLVYRAKRSLKEKLEKEGMTYEGL